MTLVRRHWPLLLVLSAGTAVRVVAWLAYRPALFYSDSADYLANTFRAPSTGWHPPGYPLFLDVFLIDRHIAIVTAVQHLLVVADAVALYVLLRRLGCRRWVSTLAATPLLLDAYQIQIEQYVLSEALFETLLVAAIVVALWPRSGSSDIDVTARAPGAVRAAIVGLLLGLATLTRDDGIGFALPMLAWLIWAGLAAWRDAALSGSPSTRGSRSQHVVPAVAAAVAAFAVPVAALLALNAASTGSSTTHMGPYWLYARVAGFANCPADDIPTQWQPLCPTQPLGHRPDPSWFESNPQSPMQRWHLHHQGPAPAASFAVRVIERQPLDYAAAVIRDWSVQFWPTRDRVSGTPPVDAWLFRTTLKPVDPTKPEPARMVEQYGTGTARLDLPLARFLRGYQRWVYLPGPLVAAALALSIYALVRRRRDPRAAAVLLLTGSAVITMLVATALVLFSWRYVLPTLALYPPAAALSWTMLRPALGGGTARSAASTGTVAANIHAPT
jgi:hypothetical protein